MTRLLILFSVLFILNSVMIGQNSNYTITLAQSFVDASKLNIQPGDTIYIQAGARVSLKLVNFHGSPTNYLVFINSGGTVVVKNTDVPYGIAIDNSSFFRFTGTGSKDIPYGIKVLGTSGGASGLGVGNGSTNFEVDHIEIAHTGFAGIFSKTDPVCDLSSNRDNFTQYQSFYHDNYIHNTGGEGMYIGHSFYSGFTTTCSGQPTVLYPSVLKGVRVYNNLVDSAGYDGIQVGSATEDCEIYGNTITNYGVAAVGAQNSGIQIGGGTTGKCYNNYISNGSGVGIIVFGLGDNDIYNNIILNAGRNYFPTDSTRRVYGIFCDDRGTIPGRSFNFYNNTIVNPKTDGIRFMSILSKNNKFYNNIIVHPGSLLSYIKYCTSQNPYINVGTVTGIDAIISNNYFDKSSKNIQFVDTLNNNFRLTNTSQAIDMGMDLSALGVTYDFDNHVRPQGNGYDIGAFESAFTRIDPPISTPDSTTVIKSTPDTTNIKSTTVINSAHVINSDQTYIDATNLKIQPGDTIYIQASSKTSLKLVNFHGSSARSIVFINRGGPVIIQNNNMGYGISIENSSFFRFTGTGSSNNKYGIKVLGTKAGASGLGVGNGSTNFEVDHIEIANTGYAGIFSKTDPVCDLSTNRDQFTQYQSIYHDNYIHKTSGEAMYIGNSSYLGCTATCDGQATVLFPSVLKGVRVYNNLIDSVYSSGIFVSSATDDCEIYANTITNYGLIIGAIPRNGIQIGTGTTGKCYNNYIANGAGNGIAVYGIGGNDIYNNVIVNAGRTYYPADSTRKAYGIIIGDQSTIAGLSFNFYNNTIVSPKTDGILFSSILSKNNHFYNNIVVNPGSLLSYKKYYPKQSPYINVGARTGIDATLSNNYFDKSITNVFFEDASNNNYRLAGNSPAINAGMNLTNLGISYDFDFNSRPSTGLFDLGAFEYLAVNTPDLAAAEVKSKFQTLSTIADVLNNSIKPVTDFTIFPNPSSGSFTVMRENTGSVNITVFDLLGHVLHKENNIIESQMALNLNVPKGQYCLTLNNGNSTVTKIIIIK